MVETLNTYNITLIFASLLIMLVISIIDGCSKNNISTNLYKTILDVMLTLILVGICNIVMISSVSVVEPTADDVLKGKTIIKYTILDGVKVDSCYVFKQNIEQIN